MESKQSQTRVGHVQSNFSSLAIIYAVIEYKLSHSFEMEPNFFFFFSDAIIFFHSSLSQSVACDDSNAWQNARFHMKNYWSEHAHFW